MNTVYECTYLNPFVKEHYFWGWPFKSVISGPVSCLHLRGLSEVSSTAGRPAIGRVASLITACHYNYLKINAPLNIAMPTMCHLLQPHTTCVHTTCVHTVYTPTATSQDRASLGVATVTMQYCRHWSYHNNSLA